jgi:type IV pilus assembly protein PilA
MVCRTGEISGQDKVADERRHDPGKRRNRRVAGASHAAFRRSKPGKHGQREDAGPAEQPGQLERDASRRARPRQHRRKGRAGRHGLNRRAARPAGFTLIELMIVLAIVGVVASFAIPAYQDYLARSRAGEGLSLAAAARLTVAENVAAGAQKLGSGYEPPLPTHNVESIAIDDNTGEITIAYTSRVTPAGSNTLKLVPSLPDDADGEDGAATSRVPLVAGSPGGGTLTWECFAADKTTSSLPVPGPAPVTPSTLPGKLAPPACRE